MSAKKIAFALILLLTTFIVCCRPDHSTVEPQEPQPVDDSSVQVVLSELPYPKLSDYRLFKGDMRDQLPNEGVLPYELSSSLFTDYALKKRFVWMPEGKSAKYVSDAKILDMPVGTVLVKTFYYDHVMPSAATQIIETRLMIRGDTGWMFAEYVWNEDQTEAYLDMAGSFKNLSWVNENGVALQANYRIPSETECKTCHKFNDQPIPIGPKPQNLNRSYTYSEGTKNQLQKWITTGYLENNLPGNIVSAIDYHDESAPLELRVRSYLDINCGHCHQEGSHCSYRPLRLAFSETTELSNMGVCVLPDEVISDTLKFIVTPAKPNRSVMYYRLTSIAESSRMPLLGRTIVHEEAAAMIKQWINTLEPCN